MKIFKTAIILLFLLSLSDLGIGQKLAFDNYKISYKVFQKQSMNMHGYKKELYAGIIKVKGKNDFKGEHPFYFASISKNLYMFAVKNSENKVMAPKIYFDKDSNILSYKKTKDNEISEKQDESKTMEEIVLSAMKIWLKSKE